MNIRYLFFLSVIILFLCITQCDDFRGIAISSLSKVFEYCLLDRFKDYFVSADNQFGFKKGVGCSFAIRTVRNIVDSYVRRQYC